MQLGILTTLSIILCGKLVKSSCIYAKDVNLVLTGKGWDDILEDLFSVETTINELSRGTGVSQNVPMLNTHCSSTKPLFQ